ncbi:hypothetical protein DFH06DRAFT_1230318 [Mycena polygramma]|nr:hypothetical protein DFH06DRAFT_1230318 [Mycena polygramma]
MSGHLSYRPLYWKMSEAILEFSRDTFAAAAIGAMLSMGIYGLTTSQTYFYYSEYPHDKPWTKALIAALWALNTVHSALLIHMVYHYYRILSVLNVVGLSGNVWSLPMSMVVHLMMTGLVIAYFLNVIFQCSKPSLRWWLLVPNVVAILMYTGFGIETIIDLFKTPTLMALAAYTEVAFLPMAATKTAADTMMAGSLCFVLFDQRTGFRRTNSLIYTLIVYAINRCLLTAGMALVVLVMIALRPNAMIYVGPQFLIPGLYANALLASLNSRHRIQGDDIVDLNSMPLSNLQDTTRSEGGSRAINLNTSRSSQSVDDLTAKSGIV